MDILLVKSNLPRRNSVRLGDRPAVCPESAWKQDALRKEIGFVGSMRKEMKCFIITTIDYMIMLLEEAENEKGTRTCMVLS